jgi:transcriptional regulator with XRE-family HTH domain
MARHRPGASVGRARAQSLGKAQTRAGNSVDVLVGHRVRALRLQYKLSLQALAAVIGVSIEEMRQFEAGEKRIGAARLLAIARVFETDVGVLFGSSAAPSIRPKPNGGRASPSGSRLLH